MDGLIVAVISGLLITLLFLGMTHMLFECIRQDLRQLRVRITEVGLKCSIGLHNWDDCVCRQCRIRSDRHCWGEWGNRNAKPCYQKRTCEHCANEEYRFVHNWGSYCTCTSCGDTCHVYVKKSWVDCRAPECWG